MSKPNETVMKVLVIIAATLILGTTSAGIVTSRLNRSNIQSNEVKLAVVEKDVLNVKESAEKAFDRVDKKVDTLIKEIKELTKAVYARGGIPQ